MKFLSVSVFVFSYALDEKGLPTQPNPTSTSTLFAIDTCQKKSLGPTLGPTSKHGVDRTRLGLGSRKEKKNWWNLRAVPD